MTVKIAIVGGSGYVGRGLTRAFIDRGYHVIVVDTVDPQPLVASSPSNSVTFCNVSVTNHAQLRSTVQRYAPDIVIHLASVGMSGSAMLSEICMAVNVEGTAALLEACLENNIGNVIYTSSYNVVFGGEPIVNGDESIQYFPISKHTDQYSPSKAIAEKLVLDNNGKRMKNGKKMKTAVIRPAAIYGEEEQRHLPRIVKHIDCGLFQFRIGNAVVDWVYIDNLVSAYVLLVEKMLSRDSADAAPAGRAYCISDGTPMENFEFLRPLCLARGKSFPSIVIPTAVMLGLAYLLENIYFISKSVGFPIEPFLTRAEVYKVGVSHYFSIARAQTDLGYKPTVSSQEGGERIAKRYRSNLSNENFFDFPSLQWWFGVVTGMVLTYIVAYADSKGALLNSPLIKPINSLALFLFRSQNNLKILFNVALWTHVFESLWAIRLARQEKCANTWYLWGIQTFILGYPSMQLLYKRQSLLGRSSRESKEN